MASSPRSDRLTPRALESSQGLGGAGSTWSASGWLFSPHPAPARAPAPSPPPPPPPPPGWALGTSRAASSPPRLPLARECVRRGGSRRRRGVCACLFEREQEGARASGPARERPGEDRRLGSPPRRARSRQPERVGQRLALTADGPSASPPAACRPPPPRAPSQPEPSRCSSSSASSLLAPLTGSLRGESAVYSGPVWNRKTILYLTERREKRRLLRVSKEDWSGCFSLVSYSVIKSLQPGQAPPPLLGCCKCKEPQSPLPEKKKGRNDGLDLWELFYIEDECLYDCRA
ncbi:uncharacterized protein LOC129650934 [Bubalus kerabau]|uniref:uncharacterized protein LOC129650934 n=1 Tax=Bubalus carabanensis TaxID=3119969 RepID=UPI00244EC98E|nr:uncharacterized protein LOC129650934 [Bubalus carabanensis]